MISALRLSDEGGSLSMTVVSEGSIPKHQLKSEDGTNLFLYIYDGTSDNHEYRRLCSRGGGGWVWRGVMMLPNLSLIFLFFSLFHAQAGMFLIKMLKIKFPACK